MKKSLFFFIAILLVVFSSSNPALAQQYKLRQVNNMMGLKTESTIYVKGMRKRSESAGMMGMPSPPITIEQCDLQRTIKINNNKKLYFIEPFSKETEEVIDEDAKVITPVKKPVAPLPTEKTGSQKGGIIYMIYNITDTGERKKMYGFTARHIWTSQKIKPSPDACTMKDSIIIKTDGWYIDLPEFNCPISYRPGKTSMPTNEKQQPDCMDRFVTRRSGKGKLGFALSETRTMIMGNKSAKTSEMEMSLETLEFSTEKLDSMLFEIPPGYTLATTESELEDKFDMAEMMKQVGKINPNNGDIIPVDNEQKKPGVLRIGVYEPTGSDGQLQVTSLQKQLATSLTGGTIEGIVISSEEEPKKYICDYTLATDFVKIKSGSKVGGLLKAIKNSDPNAVTSYTIEANLTLVKLSDGSTRLKPNVSGKYDGKIDEAAGKALDDGSNQIVRGLK